MPATNRNGKDLHPDGAGQHADIISLGFKILSAILGLAVAVYGAIEFPNLFKWIVMGVVGLFWAFFECNKYVHNFTLNLVWKTIQKGQGMPTDKEKEAQTPAMRWGLGGLLLLFLIGWGIEVVTEPPLTADNYYMVLLDASDAMKEPFDGFPSKWNAVQEAFHEFYEVSEEDSNYGLVLIGGQNTQEISGTPCSLPTVPLIPLVSKNRKPLPHRELTLSELQNQVEGQQPEGGGSLKRAFFLAKNQLEDMPAEAPKVLVLIANASDTCEGRIDWDTLAGEIERVNRSLAVRKELILVDVEASQETAAFAEQVNAMNVAGGMSPTIVQVVQNYQQLVMSIAFVLERNVDDVTALESAATATAQSEKSPVLKTVTDSDGPATPMVVIPKQPKAPKPYKVVMAASATSTPTLTPTATLTFTPTLTFTSTETFTPTATFTYTPTSTCTPTATKPLITIYPTATRHKDNDDEDDDNKPPPPPPTEYPCCVHCGADSKPCGDSCISLTYECHITEPGCACP